jgi:iron complex transport system ATP-binding protein
MTPLVQARGLSLAGRLEESAIELRSGELACLIGPNGSGKTSLLHALAGIGSPGGKVRIGGVDPGAVPVRQRMQLLSFLPASRDVSWPLVARDVIALGCAGPADRERIPEMLDDLELGPFADRRLDRMSTGERTRVLIARALVARPRLVLLDEPAANLDPLWQLRLMSYLRETCRRTGQALLVAMHNLDLAGDYADRLIIMRQGRIAADGTAAEIMSGPDIPRIFGIERRDGRWSAVDQAG